MTWFKVDDGFYGHEKVLLIPRAQRALALGTWVLCGTWSADKKKDGYVPFHILDELGASVDGAEALVKVKLWTKRKTGYWFVNWNEFQPTRAELDEKKEKERVRQAEYRAARKAKQQAAEYEDVTTRQVRNTSLPSRPVPSRPDDDVTKSSRGKLRAVPPPVDEPVDNSLYGKIVATVGEMGITVDKLVVADIIDFIDQRRGPRAEPIKAPDRYYPGAIRSSWAEVQQFIHQKGLAS